jgi:hypothetical protein
MAMRALSHPSVNRTLGDVWDLLVDVRDSDGVLVDAVPDVTITLPAGTTETPTPETVTTGVYLVQYTLATAGRYVATMAADDYGLADFAAFVTAVTPASGMPTVGSYREYDEDGGGSWSDPAIQGALDTEAAAQRKVCVVGAVYDVDLREALLRRVQCNLARRALPLAVLRGDAEAGSSTTMPPGRDPEVRRLEAPFRKLVMG